MFSGLKRLLGNITVEVVGTEVRVEGIDTHVMSSHLRREFASNKFSTHMFTRMDRSSFALPTFFLPDFVYMIEVMAGMRSLNVPIRTLLKLRDLLLENTWLKEARQEPYSKLDYSKLKEMTLTPLAFQQEFFERYDRVTGQYNLRGLLLAGAAGSGKTFTSLALSQMLDVDLVVVVCPKNALEEVWRKSISGIPNSPSKFKHPPSAWYAHDKQPYRKERFIVGHYEALEELRLVAGAACKPGMRAMVSLDESHNLNNDKSLRTERFLQLCRELDSQDVVWLSGTPIKALATEAIPLIRSIDPLFTEDVEARFRKIYNTDKPRAVRVLSQRMGIVSFVVEKKELELAEPIFREIKVRMPHGNYYTLDAVKARMLAFIQERTAYYKSREKQDRAVYDEGLLIFEAQIRNPEGRKQFEQYKRLVKIIQQAGGDFRVKDEMAWVNRFELGTIYPSLTANIKADWKAVRALIKYPHLKIQGECLGRIVGGDRTKCHVDMVEYIDFRAITESSTKKTVAFTSFVPVLEASATPLAKQGLSPLFVSAKTNKNLAQIVREFDSNEDINPLVATYASLSTAVPLTMADTVILLDSPFRDYILQQAVSRVHRLDADTQVYVYTVTLDTGSEPNISSRSMDILKWSQDQVASIMGIRSPFEIKDNMEEFSVAVEGLDQEVQHINQSKPSYLSW